MLDKVAMTGTPLFHVAYQIKHGAALMVARKNQANIRFGFNLPSSFIVVFFFNRL